MVLYDSEEINPGLGHASRGWFMFHVFGHPSISLLEGGLVKWKRDGHPTTKAKFRVFIKKYSISKKFVLKSQFLKIYYTAIFSETLKTIIFLKGGKEFQKIIIAYLKIKQ